MGTCRWKTPREPGLASLRDMPLPSCAHCGVPDCEALFHACLELDFGNSGYGAVHHLVVSAYMLQHDTYAAGVRTAMADFVLEHLDRPPTAHAMRRIRAATDGAVRVRRRTNDQMLARTPPKEPSLPQPTVADVDTASAEAYCCTVRSWAQAVAHGAAHGG